MITFKSLFSKFYPDIIGKATEDNFASGYTVAQIIKRIVEEEKISLPSPSVQALFRISERCKYEDLRVENWDRILKIIKQFSGVTIDPHVAKLLARNNPMAIQNFSYRLFGVVVYIKDKLIDPSGKQQSRVSSTVIQHVANFERLNQAKSLGECEKAFEKLAFVLARSLEIKPFQV